MTPQISFMGPFPDGVKRICALPSDPKGHRAVFLKGMKPCKTDRFCRDESLFREQPDGFPDAALTAGVLHADNEILIFPVPVDAGSDLQRKRRGPVIAFFMDP